jgi:hypothetical protein
MDKHELAAQTAVETRYEADHYGRDIPSSLQKVGRPGMMQALSER